MLPYLLGAGLLGGGLYLGNQALSQDGRKRPPLPNVTPGYNPDAQVPPILTTGTSANRRDGVLMAPMQPVNRVNPYNSALGQAMLNADKGAPAMLGGYFQGLEAGRVNQFNADSQNYQDTIASLADLAEAQGGAPDPGDGKYIASALDALDDALYLVDNNPLSTTGLFGQISKMFGGTPANDLAGLITTIESSIGFNRLNEMRKASATGASGLGQLSKNELDQLNASIASLKQSQSREMFVRNLRKIRKYYASSLAAINQERKMYNQMYGANLPMIDIPGVPLMPSNNQPQGSGPGGSTNLPQNNNAGGGQSNPNPNASGSGGGGGNVVGQTQSGANIVKVN